MLYICAIKYNAMIRTASVKVQTAFRLSKELIDRLKVKAQKENRSLNNYVETVLMDIAYDEPNDETVASLSSASAPPAESRFPMVAVELAETSNSASPDRRMGPGIAKPPSVAKISRAGAAEPTTPIVPK